MKDMRKMGSRARRWGCPEELAGTAVHLASSASDSVNGQIIPVDGGMISLLRHPVSGR